MKLSIGWTSLWLGASVALGAEVRQEIDWSLLQKEGRLLAGEVVAPEAGSASALLKLANAQAGPMRWHILTLDSPGITAATYALKGWLRYQEVQGHAYLELWSTFPGGKSYFSRTAAESGPMQSITGSSAGRAFVLPFYIGQSDDRPERLDLHLVMPGSGTVYLGPMTLEEFSPEENPLAAAGSWWSDRQAGWLGAVLGCLLGGLGALVGLLSQWGRGRSLALGLLRLLLVAGVVLLAVGVAALACAQSFHVVYVPLLAGGLSAVLSLSVTPSVRRRFQQIELRKMAAQDLA